MLLGFDGTAEEFGDENYKDELGLEWIQARSMQKLQEKAKDNTAQHLVLRLGRKWGEFNDLSRSMVEHSALVIHYHVLMQCLQKQKNPGCPKDIPGSE